MGHFFYFLVVCFCLLERTESTDETKIYSYENANKANCAVDISKKMNIAFTPEGIKNIALISMVKNEEDIIFENLVWHFTIGFRKFIIIDNKSDDNTRKLIEKFAELTKNQAIVLIIDDPILEYIQSRVTTGAYNLGKSVWPEVTWFFPVDADEFWSPEKPLQIILEQIPNDIDAIVTRRAQHRPTESYYNYASELPFYEKIPHRVNALDSPIGAKIALRASTKNTAISQGNHILEPSEDKNYESGNALGLHMTEFSLRSIEHTHKKLSNGSKANIAAQNLGILPQGAGSHWNTYVTELEQHGDQAAKNRFNGTFLTADKAVHDPLPMKECFAMFYKITNEGLSSY